MTPIVMSGIRWLIKGSQWAQLSVPEVGYRHGDLDQYCDGRSTIGYLG